MGSPAPACIRRTNGNAVATNAAVSPVSAPTINGMIIATTIGA